MIADSVIGVSITRPRPNFFGQPCRDAERAARRFDFTCRTAHAADNVFTENDDARIATHLGLQALR